MILLIDNYDSFTFNVYQYLGVLGAKVKVVRNDAHTVEQIQKMKPEAIVISPGPGHPGEAGVTLDVIQNLSPKIPTLGICLGHQAIGQAFGGKVVRAEKLMHGKCSEVFHKKGGIFKGLASPVNVTRYHSLVVERKGLPKCFEITAETKDKVIMGLKHKRFPIEGVQFHPESYMTDEGLTMLKNFLKRV